MSILSIVLLKLYDSTVRENPKVPKGKRDSADTGADLKKRFRATIV